MPDASAIEVYLQGEQQGEEELVVLVEATAGVAESLKCQVLNDVSDTLLGDGRFVRSGSDTEDVKNEYCCPF